MAALAVVMVVAGGIFAVAWAAKVQGERFEIVGSMVLFFRFLDFRILDFRGQ